MKPKNLAVSVLCGLLFLGPLGGLAGTQVHQTSDDHFEVILNRSSATPVTALQVTDLHLGKKDFWKQDLTTFERI